MNILILGGSNAGLRNGWATQLQQRADAEDEVNNGFLGAVGSLYGLMRLIKGIRDKDATPDAIILEFFLNDILLFEARVLQPRLVADALEQIANICAGLGVRLLFLCLEPRPDARKSLALAKARAHGLYGQAARRHGITLLSVRDIFPEGPTALDYQDENHFTPEASARVADVTLAMLRGDAVTAPKESGASPTLAYVAAPQAQTEGPVRRVDIESKVFSGPFLEISRGGSSIWPGAGQLVALMLQSTDSSGCYLICGAGRALRKNARSQMQEVVKNLMLLHYATRRIHVASSATISMPTNERALMASPEDLTLLAAPPTAKFDEQTLYIHGVIFWRPLSILRRIARMAGAMIFRRFAGAE